jgi:hypothetical protein
VVDERRLFVVPGRRWRRQAGAAQRRPRRPELADERRFGSGMVYLRYRVRR